jgi:hypothetical protein
MSRPTCIKCNADISHKRKNAKFCSENCRKDQFQRRERQYSKVNATSSLSERRSQKELFDSNHRISEIYYSTAPDKRPTILISIIRLARLGDPKSKRILCNQVFLKANPRKDKHKCWRRLPTIAQAAHKLCMRGADVGIEKMVTGDPSHFAKLEAMDLKSLTVSVSDNSPPPMPSNGTIVLPTDLTLSPMSLLAYELACASAGITVVRTNKSRRMEDNKAAA